MTNALSNQVDQGVRFGRMGRIGHSRTRGLAKDPLWDTSMASIFQPAGTANAVERTGLTQMIEPLPAIVAVRWLIVQQSETAGEERVDASGGVSS